MIDMATWGWPQWVLIALVIVDLCTHGALHGKPRKPYNSAFKTVDAIVLFVLLLAGGYFT